MHRITHGEIFFRCFTLFFVWHLCFLGVIFEADKLHMIKLFFKFTQKYTKKKCENSFMCRFGLQKFFLIFLVFLRISAIGWREDRRWVELYLNRETHKREKRHYLKVGSWIVFLYISLAFFFFFLLVSVWLIFIHVYDDFFSPSPRSQALFTFLHQL